MRRSFTRQDAPGATYTPLRFAPRFHLLVRSSGFCWKLFWQVQCFRDLPFCKLSCDTICRTDPVSSEIAGIYDILS